MLDHTTLMVIGGCRSGKSSYALNRANHIHEVFQPDHQQQKLFLATSVPTDAEMEERVVKHQNERGNDWRTIEEPVRIDRVIKEESVTSSVILVDCLTLWTSNIIYELKSPDRIEQAIANLETTLKDPSCPVILVTNEVGYGIVPENSLARQFRDLAGAVNQRVAAVVDRVVQTVAGIDVQIKPRA